MGHGIEGKNHLEDVITIFLMCINRKHIVSLPGRVFVLFLNAWQGSGLGQPPDKCQWLSINPSAFPNGREREEGRDSWFGEEIKPALMQRKTIQ